jgi:signal transduction histidine kinase
LAVNASEAAHRALIIEDDADARANLADILQLDGFEVVTAGTAGGALARPDWPQISVVILDRRLPDGNALEHLPRIREMAPHASVVIVTGFADLDGAIIALRYGAADYILKPINADALRASLARIVNRLRTEEALRESQQRLQEERQRALQNERLAAIGETMTALIHESRNAIQRSKACLEMLTLEVQDRPAALDLASRAQRAQEDLQRLYEEVRQYAAPITLTRRRCNLRALWQEAWQHLSHHDPDKGLRLEDRTEGLDLHCNADPFAIQQVWRNILENAIAASPPAATITVHSALRHDGRRSTLAVSFHDQGPGLSEEQQRRIFEPFFTTKTKGTGLGMAIAQRIVSAHGGSIAATGGPQGATIEVTLPRGYS